MAHERSLKALQKRYAYLSARLSDSGLIFKRTITPRIIGTPNTGHPERAKRWGSILLVDTKTERAHGDCQPLIITDSSIWASH